MQGKDSEVSSRMAWIARKFSNEVIDFKDICSCDVAAVALTESVGVSPACL
jgi:hypothetical protein